jgi:hypothetical protein
LGLFRRAKPAHQSLAEAGGLIASQQAVEPVGLPTQPPGWDGRPRGEPGIHGVSRSRQWDAVVTVDAPELPGDDAQFVVLPDGTLVDESEGPERELAVLADAAEGSVSRPYRAEAVRREATIWVVAARRIDLVEARGVSGEEAELVVTAADRSLTIDDQRILASVPAFEAAGRRVGGEFVVRASRVYGDLWEIEANPL